jgi:hypothetical protein
MQVTHANYIYDRFYANGRHFLSADQDRAFRLFSVAQVGCSSFRGFFFSNLRVILGLFEE